MELKKILMLVGLVVALFASGLIYQSVGEKRLAEGSRMPNLKIDNGQSSVDLKKKAGRYVLVDFWAASDAQSRLKSNQYNALGLERKPGVDRISVNFDKSKRLFNEIVDRDRLAPQSQFHVADKEARRIMRKFRLNEGYKSFLIDPDGRIERVNPDPAYLARKFHS